MNASLKTAIWMSLVLWVGCGKSSRDAQMATVSEPTAALAIGSAEMNSADARVDEGVGPGQGGEQYDQIVDNPFLRALEQPLSTFSIDVDTASYSKVRQYLVGYNKMPRPDAVRIEELLNYFQYGYEAPAEGQAEPFATHVAVSQCPWNHSHRLVRLALKGHEINSDVRPSSNLVLLIDSSLPRRFS